MSKAFKSFLVLGAFLGAVLETIPVGAQTPARGEAIFIQRCSSCHVAIAGKAPTIGPNLAGVVGRKVASTRFGYSVALKAAKFRWDRAKLDRFLAAPGKLVPGTRMVVSIPQAQDRADIIAFLASRK